MVTTTAWVKRIDQWRRHEPGLPSLSEAIRLVDMGLEERQEGRNAPADHACLYASRRRRIVVCRSTQALWSRN
jgi:hypothetical protein